MFKVGISCIDITPPIGINLDGFAARDPSSVGVNDRLKAVSFVFSNGKTTAAIVSCDLLDVDTTFVKAIRKETNMRTGIKGDHIAISCTHTHYGPTISGSYAFFGSTEIATAYREVLKFYLSGAVQDALENMREATFGVGWGSSNIGINRRQKNSDGTVSLGQNLDKPIDHQVGVMRINGFDSKPLFSIVNFACHPVSQTWQMRFISADYPGKTREVIETLTGTRCMFLQGACGNINPVLMEYSYEPARKLGTQLGCEAVKIWEDIKTAPAEPFGVTSEIVKIPRYNLGSKERAEIFVANLEKELAKWQAESAKAGLVNWAKLRLRRAREALKSWKTGKPMLNIKAEIMALKIGDIGIAFAPGEIFNEIGSFVKQHSPFSSTFFVGYANGYIGYVPTLEAYDEGGYEVNDACQVGPEADGLISKKCVELLEQLQKKN